MALSQPTGIARHLEIPPLPSIQVRNVLARIHDDQIEALLGERRLFADGLIYVLIGALIAKQPDGEQGTLSTDSDNLFYTPSSFVNAYLDDTGWQIVKLRRELGGLPRFPGARVLPPPSSWPECTKTPTHSRRGFLFTQRNTIILATPAECSQEPA